VFLTKQKILMSSPATIIANVAFIDENGRTPTKNKITTDANAYSTFLSFLEKRFKLKENEMEIFINEKEIKNSNDLNHQLLQSKDIIIKKTHVKKSLNIL